MKKKENLTEIKTHRRYKMAHTTEQAEEIFVATFYGLFDSKDSFEPEDDNSSDPWACPWYWLKDFVLDLDKPEEQAHKHFANYAGEIRDLLKEERSFAKELARQEQEEWDAIRSL